MRDSANVLIVLLLKASETEADLVDHDELDALLGAAGNTETIASDYGRKTGITGSISIDDNNARVDCDIPDQTWTAIGNGQNDTLTKAIVAYEESAADTGRIPLSHHDFAVTTSNNDLTIQFASAGFGRAA